MQAALCLEAEDFLKPGNVLPINRAAKGLQGGLCQTLVAPQRFLDACWPPAGETNAEIRRRQLVEQGRRCAVLA